MMRWIITALLLFSLPAVALELPLAAQSKSGAVRFYAGAGTDSAARELAEIADADRANLSQDLGRDYDGTTNVYLAAGAEAFQSMMPEGASVPGWASGVAFPELNLIVLRTGGGGSEGASTRAVFRHEMSHISVGRLTHGQIPRWFLEGLAIVRAGNLWSREGPSLIRAGLANNFLSLESLRTHFPERPSDAELAYAESASFMQYLIDRNGEPALQEMMRQVMRGSPFDDAVLRVSGSTPRQLENAWRRSLDKWVLALDFATSRELLWMLMTVLTIIVGLRARASRRARLVRLEHDEKEESDRALLRAPAAWADGSPEDEPQDGEGAVSATSAVVSSDSSEEMDEEDDDSTPRKPTIH